MGEQPRLRDYQEDAVTFVYERDRSMVLAPVGAGKTAITVTAMSELNRAGFASRWLVIAPLRVCLHVWPVEIKKWSGLTFAVVNGTPAQRRAALLENADVFIVNYENLQWLADTANLTAFSGIVFDELTRLKNPSGKRFKALHKLIDAIPIRIGLTGSFTSNGLEDVFGQCKIIDQKLLGRSKGAFLQQYFIDVGHGYSDWEPRPGALEAVMERIKPATYLLEPGEYTNTLPPIHTVVLRCAMPDRTAYEKMKTDLAAEFGKQEVIAANAAVVTGKLQQLAAGFVYNTVQEPHPTIPGKFLTTRDPIWVGSYKFDLLDDVLEENQHANTIIVYNYAEELAELQRRYPQARTIYDPEVIEQWSAGKVELLLIHPKSAGHGLNLQHGGCRLVFLSLPWSLELYEQTIGRLHRSGQRHDVWCYVLLTAQTVDERIWGALHDKRAISDVAIKELRG